MPRLTKAKIDRIRELCAEGYTNKEAAEREHVDPGTMAKYRSREPEEKESLRELRDILSYIKAKANIIRKACPYSKYMVEGKCDGFLLDAREWGPPSVFKKIFSEFLEVEKNGRRYYKPDVPDWYCYFCSSENQAKKQRDDLSEIGEVLKYLCQNNHEGWCTLRYKEKPSPNISITTVREGNAWRMTPRWRWCVKHCRHYEPKTKISPNPRLLLPTAHY